MIHKTIEQPFTVSTLLEPGLSQVQRMCDLVAKESIFWSVNHSEDRVIAVGYQKQKYA